MEQTAEPKFFVAAARCEANSRLAKGFRPGRRRASPLRRAALPRRRGVDRDPHAVHLGAAKVLARFDDEAETEADALAALQAAEVDRRLRFPDPFRSPRHGVSLDGFSLHAGVQVHANDRQGLERLCRYAVRPPFALHRLSAGEHGRLVYRMKRPRGGSLFLVLTPDELLTPLATLVPPPRIHRVRYHGVFAPNAKARARVVPQPLEPPPPPAPTKAPRRPGPASPRRRRATPCAHLP